MIDEYETSLAATRLPYESKIRDLTVERDSHNARIRELLAEIEEHRRLVKSLETEIVNEEAAVSKADESFNPKRSAIAADDRQLKVEIGEFEARVREIEAPFQSLLDTTAKREIEINAVTTATEKLGQQIVDGERDSTQCESAAGIINQLCKDHFTYNAQRAELQTRYDNACLKAAEKDQRRADVYSETAQLRGTAQQASDFLADARSKRPQLEESKKGAVRSKNFRGAQQIAQQLTQLVQKIETSEKFVAEAAEKLDRLESEATKLSAEITAAQVEADDARTGILHLDYEFLAMAVKLIRQLFELSPYAKRLLDPLFVMLEFRLGHVEVPQEEMSQEEMERNLAELNVELQTAIDQDDFDTADAVQKKIDRLQAKLDKITAH
jgi:chromosome segregation ATPase